ncbi:MAG: hypothetical protein ACLU4B_03530 [Bilophila wadsworthia]
MEQMCTAVFAFLESAKPFFQYGKPLQELLPFFVRALGGILPLDALAIVRMEGKKGVCETACWSGTPHLPEALMLRAFNGKEFPKAFDTPFSEEALAALFPEETAGKLNWLALPFATPMRSACCLSAGSPEKRSGWIGSRIFYGLCAPCSGFSSREKHIANSNRFISACSTRRWIK